MVSTVLRFFWLILEGKIRSRRILVRVELIFKAPQQYVEIAFPLDALHCREQIEPPGETVR